MDKNYKYSDVVDNSKCREYDGNVELKRIV